MISSKKRTIKNISANKFDTLFDNKGNVSDYLDFENAVVVKRVNVDFPSWMIDNLDQEALKLNISRQAVIKMWISERLREN